MKSDDAVDGAMPAPIDVREGLENRRQRALIEAALFDEPAPPMKIGRFTIVRMLGEGGMGVVYLAYDEELDRRVAVKLLHGGRGPEDEAQRRLQREAQAMARLAHPNVVAVHDVGTFEGQVFVAMEFVAGRDLRAWLRSEPRTWRELLSQFVQAGEGLAAAHEAELVHRDFKPDNVLVGDDGRVRVADFGLAFDGTTSGLGPDVTTQVSAEVLHTETGAVLGTPAYMAPEQIRGERADARTDQFGFCVALYEGLYGTRPFSGKTLAALAVAIEAGDIAAPPEDTEVPHWLRAAVVRGLAAEPDSRWPSMRALLDVLGDDPLLRRRRRIRALAVTLVVVAVVVAASWAAVRGIRHGARQRFWAAFNEHLLEIERERATRQALDAKQRAQDSARMGMVDRYQPDTAPAALRDPTAAAALLRDVEGEAGRSARWTAQANVVLGQPISSAVLTEHRAVVSALVFDHDAPILYSASADGTVRRFEVGGGGRSEVLVRHEQPVTALALDPRGHRLASGSAAGELVIWEIERSEEVVRETVHTAAIKALAFDPEGTTLASASDDGTARLRPIGEGKPKSLRGHDGGVLVVAFDAEGTRVLTASRDGTARLWRAEDGTAFPALEGHTKGVFHARFVGAHGVVTASDDGTARLWRSPTTAGATSEVMVRHDGAITSLDARGDRFSTTSQDGRPRVWSLGGGDEIVLRGHEGDVWAGGITVDGQRVVTAGFDQDVRLHAIDGRGGSEVLRGHRARLTSIALHPRGRWLATGSFDGMVRVWDLQRPRMRWTLVGHEGQVWSAAVDPTGERVATISHDGTARLWSAADGEPLAVLRSPEPTQALTSVAFSPDGGTLATGSSGGRLELWDPRTGRARPLVGHGRDVWHLAFDARGRRLASASHDGTVRIWEVDSAQLVHVLRSESDSGPAAMVSRVAWVDGDSQLLTADFGGELKRWDATNGALLERRRVHEGAILEMVLAPDGRGMATASADGTALLWAEAGRGEPVVLQGHERALGSVAFGPAGRRVVTASEDGTARVWDLEGRSLATLVGGSAAMWSARFSADGRWVFTASDDGTIQAWAPEVVEGAVAQWSHEGPVLGLWPDPKGQWLLSTSSDATARLWRVDRLETDPERLHGRLVEATDYCVPVAQRERLLGEDTAEAKAALARCRGGSAVE